MKEFYKSFDKHLYLRFPQLKLKTNEIPFDCILTNQKLPKNSGIFDFENPEEFNGKTIKNS